ncbi:COX3 oxidase, partial [Acromyrmex charruanus]
MFKGIKIGIILFIISKIFLSFFSRKIQERKKSLLITITLGIYFSLLQLIEYVTGFHGIHVIIGIFLSVCLIRLYNIHFSSYHHFGFEAASLY